MLFTIILRTLLALVIAVVAACADHKDTSLNDVESDLQHISAALKLYRLDCGNYPSELTGLAVLGPTTDDNCPSRQTTYINTLPNDPWGHPYAYRLLGEEEFVLVSLGSDGKQGGYGDAADIQIAN